VRKLKIITYGIFMIVLLLSGSQTAACTQTSNAQTDIPFEHIVIDGNGPVDIWQKTIGDLDGDGRIDLVAGGRSSGGLVWYKNPDWEKFTINSGTGHSTDAEVGDIDGDGDNDLISLTISEIRWYENPEWTIHTIEKRELHDLELSDFDDDGDIDIVARNQGEFGHNGDALHFYRQDTPSSWEHRSLSIANGEGLHVVDLDNDGDQDVVIGGSWYENSGDIIGGDWTAHVYTSSWTHPNAYVSSGDINGDGRLDIVLSPSELAGETYRIAWFEAPSDPKMANWSEHIVTDGVEAVHHFIDVADMDNDGDQDVVTAEMHQGDNPDEVKIYLNSGSGQSWAKQIIATTGSHSMRAVDVDGDGDIDLFGANWKGSQVDLWENVTCKNSLDNWQRHVIDSAKPWRAVFITSADIDGDGNIDISTGGWWYKNPGTPGSTWVRNTLGAPLNNMAAVYDFDGDSDIDVLGTQGKGSGANASFVWAQNDGSGSFIILDNIEDGDGDFLQGVAIDYYQTEGNPQVALSWHIGGKGVQALTIPSSPASQTWQWNKLSSTSQNEDLSSGDIDRDGDIDLLLGTIWLSNDDGSWSTHVITGNSEDPDRNRLADVNGDGKLDAVVGFEAISTSGKLVWYQQGVSATSEWSEHLIAEVVGPMSLDVADMDQDGDFDIVVGEHNLSDPSSASLYIFENTDGKGDSWSVHTVYVGDEHHDGAQVVDIDDDGDLDIISIGWGHDQVLLYENIGVGCKDTPHPSGYQ
jgi:hypothetical protein